MATVLMTGGFATAAQAPDPHEAHGVPPAQGIQPPGATQLPHTEHAASPADDEHAGHGDAPSSGDDHHDGAPTGSALPVGNAAAPEIIPDSAADRLFGRAQMDRARRISEKEHGGERVSKVMASLLEYTTAGEDGGYQWELEAWYGGDTHRLVVKSDGEGIVGEGLETVDVQVIYSRAVARYTDVQMGLRYDIEPDGRAYATFAVETLFPYWFEAEAEVFLSDRGDLLSRLEGSYDLRLTQRLILQPNLELDLSAQNINDAGIGSGLSSSRIGLRLRYDIRRELAPYVGIEYQRRFGRTADIARAQGEGAADTMAVIGFRVWF
ncbi:MAG: copper resistance protein B [Chloroflexota bacterium]|nr:copper resistance protein B [Chloroflexota bacterium]